MLFPRTLLTAVGAALLLPTGIAQIASQPSVNLPRTIRLCGAGLCQTLTWNDGHYDGRLDGQTNASTTFGVVRWDREAVDLVGIVSRPTPNGDYVTGIFKGTISQGGNSVDDGTDNWRAGGATGSLPFKMTWSPDDPVRPFSLAAAATLPKLMRLCASKCVVLKLNGGNFDVYEENDPATKTATYLVSSFSSDAVFLELLVPNGIRAIVTGKVQGETMAEAKLTFLNGFDGITAPLVALEKSRWMHGCVRINCGTQAS
jgi:hypothetical protein